MKQCLMCGKEIRSGKYCNNKCQSNYQYINYINRWRLGLETGLKGGVQTSNYIRRYLFEKYKSSCSKCGWSEKNPYTGTIPLEVHHINNIATDNSENNLELLCPNCHSLTKNWKGANKIRSNRLYRQKTISPCVPS